MIDDLSYRSISLVLKSWDQAKQSEVNEEKLGIDTLLRLFELKPETKAIFGFPVKGKLKATGMQRMGLLIHGRRIVSMIQGTFGLLGPDVDLLEEFLFDLGRRHTSYGVKPEYFQYLGQAFQEVLKDILGDMWTDKIDRAWEAVFYEITAEITRSMAPELKETIQ
jgi:hemoglobin-like flavoprotein